MVALRLLYSWILIVLLYTVTHACSKQSYNISPSLGQSDTLSILIELQSDVLEVLQSAHIDPPAIDDAFSTKLFSNLIDLIDPDRMYFLESEMKTLGRNLYDLDNQIHACDISFFIETYEFLLQGIKRLKSIHSSIDIDSIDFRSDDVFQTDRHNAYFAVSQIELADEYLRYCKYRTLQIFNDLLNQEHQLKNQNKKSTQQLLEQAKIKFLSDQENQFKISLLNTILDYFKTYLDAIAHAFDPYSEYYSTEEKISYDIESTGKVVGTGMVINPSKRGMEITRILNGGPVWQSNEIAIGDIIIGLTQEDGRYIDCRDTRVSDIASCIRGKAGTSITLHILDQSEQVKEIKIFRQEVISYQDRVKSLLLSNNDGTEPVGYIDIRNFYQTTSHGEIGSSSIEVMGYLEYLEKEGISALIIDLRDNPGGILEESLLILEALIGSGPLLQVKDNHGSIKIEKGILEDAIYTGDLIVLINQNTASAAEVLASTLQDYHRGIIIGSSTYGKGTVQKFVNLDDLNTTKLANGLSRGELKYTFAKYYRITGKATQMVGVTPDITLPSLLDSLEIGDRFIESSVTWSKISPLEFVKSPLDLTAQLKLLRVHSKLRVASDPEFNNVKRAAIDIKPLYTETIVPLALEDYRAHNYLINSRLRDASNAGYADYPLIETQSVNLKVNLKESKDESRWMSLKSQDIYLNEAMNILHEMKEMD